MQTPIQAWVASARIVLFGDTHLGFDLPVQPPALRWRSGDDRFTNFYSVFDHAASNRPDAP
ncbi:MAG: hypothetical protein IH609_14005 [Dehalococcoidia bacterium]|nr:hypothetical protein [Dehalococcoidia bacterium]